MRCNGETVDVCKQGNENEIGTHDGESIGKKYLSVVRILAIQRPDVCSLCLYPLDASF